VLRIAGDPGASFPKRLHDRSEFRPCQLRLMSSQRPLLDQVFILRFWRETADASEQDRWRVLVRNINTRRRDVVDDVQRAFAIVAANLNAAAGESDKPELFQVDHQIPNIER
jgi:hypothetical protein